WGQRLSSRWIMFSETLLSDREHRAIWDGPALPDWQRWLFAAGVLAACAVCLGSASRWARLVGAVFLMLGAFLFLSAMPVAEHHLVTLVPLAALVVAFAILPIAAQHSWGRRCAWALAIVYFGSAIYWQAAAVRGLRRSGGTGQWSDAVFALS